MSDTLQSLLATAGSGATPWKASCRVYAAINQALSGVPTIDGVALAVGDPVLLGGQTNARDNGPYIVATGAWSRRVDWAKSEYVHLGSVFPIMEGATYANHVIKLTSPTNGPVRLGLTSLTFTDQGLMGSLAGYSGPGQDSIAYSPTIAPDFDGITDLTIGALTGGLSIDPPVNLIPGGIYTLTISQDSGGWNKAVFGSGWVFPDGLDLICQAGSASTTWTFRFDGSDMVCINRVYSVGYVSFSSGSPALVPGVVNILSGTVSDPILPDAGDWAGMANAVTVKLANLSGGCDVQPSGSDTINGAGSFPIASDYGQAVIMSTGSSALLASPGA